MRGSVEEIGGDRQTKPTSVAGPSELEEQECHSGGQTNLRLTWLRWTSLWVRSVWDGV